MGRGLAWGLDVGLWMVMFRALLSSSTPDTCMSYKTDNKIQQTLKSYRFSHEHPHATQKYILLQFWNKHRTILSTLLRDPMRLLLHTRLK